MTRALYTAGLAIVIALGTLVAIPTAAFATTTKACGGGGVFQGTQNPAGTSSSLTLVAASLEKQAVPLCPNPGPLQWSASSWWIMITQGPSTANDYIQYGFWNCAVGCGTFCCDTGGEVHEFWEQNNGNIGGLYRKDLGTISGGNYALLLEWRFSGYSWFHFTRGGVLQDQSLDNGWRDWSLTNAKFEMYSETWNIGDQNGGSATNKLVMSHARWGKNQGAAKNVVMPDCSAGSPSTDYACESYKYFVLNDSIRTWTKDR